MQSLQVFLAAPITDFLGFPGSGNRCFHLHHLFHHFLHLGCIFFILIVLFQFRHHVSQIRRHFHVRLFTVVDHIHDAFVHAHEKRLLFAIAADFVWRYPNGLDRVLRRLCVPHHLKALGMMFLFHKHVGNSKACRNGDDEEYHHTQPLEITLHHLDLRQF